MIRKIKLISKVMKSLRNQKIFQTIQTIAVRILTNASRSEDNQIMKFRSVNRLFFLKNHTQNGVEKLFPDLFLKI